MTEPFKMRSGNGPLKFKNMGSSPAKHVDKIGEGSNLGNKEAADAHNASSATDNHYGDPHGPKPESKKESPVKQTVGGDAGEAIDHWKKYQAGKTKMPKSFNMTGKDTWANKSKDILNRNKPSKLIKVPDVDLINKKLTDIGKGTTKKMTKKVVKKGLGKTILKGAGKVAKFAAKRLGPIGAAITAYEAGSYMGKIHPIENFPKDVKKSLKKEAKTGSTVGKPKY